MFPCHGVTVPHGSRSDAHDDRSARIVDMAAPIVLTELLRLPAEDRAKLARELIRSLDGERDADAARRGTKKSSAEPPKWRRAPPRR
jgi:hypothetical protein